MRIKHLVPKVAAYLIGSGLLLLLLGYALSGFSIEQYKTTPDHHRWYNVVNLGDSIFLLCFRTQMTPYF